MTFQTLRLLATPKVYKQIKTVTGATLDDGFYTKGKVVIDYEAIDGFEEPYSRSESSDTQLSGVSSSESRYLYTNAVLKLHNDLEGNQSLADIVYLEDPRTNPNAMAYVAYDKENWKANPNMKLIPQDYSKIILVRKEKVEKGGLLNGASAV